jgi:hypothetical protein
MTDAAKEAALKAELIGQGSDGPPFVDIVRFFDGNDDEGSIGCNLLKHPGLQAFHDVLVGLSSRADVEAVYAQIAEIDPGTGLWPFTDTVFVAGTIAPGELARLVAPLQPDEAASAEGVPVPARLRDRHGKKLLYAWWD